jgi:phosphatidylglycerophosphate synthase
MTTLPSPPTAAAEPAGLRTGALREVWAAGAALALAALAIAALAGFSVWYPVKASLAFAAAVALLSFGLAAHPHPRFGAANRITLARLVVALLLLAMLGEPLPVPDPVAWAVVVIATAAALLDAADGPLARASGMASEFGARFDLETDALMVLVLCGLIVHFGKAGPWVLAAGLMRYAFVAAAGVWPWLARPLPPSLRRKTVCVLQISGLIVCLGPSIARGWSAAIAAAGLAMLSYSFAADIRWLARHRHQPLEIPA